jgi:cytochrome c-type biogenesis protein CcmH
MAEDMKRRIRELIVEGRSDEEIRAFFVDRYGAWILLEPPKSGFNLAAWLLPGAAVLVGAVGLVLAARRWASRAPPRRSVEPPPESSYLDRLERELEETE